MDADWSVEIGAGLPSVEVPWAGWIDLRDPATAAARLAELPEVGAYPELGQVLHRIHTDHPAVLTSKCDVFPIDIGSNPPAMLDREDGEHAVLCGLGSYIDLLFPGNDLFASFAAVEPLVRRVATELLAPIPMPRTSVEIVIRPGRFFAASGYGLTLYAMGFGRDPAAARAAWGRVLRVSAYITLMEVTGRVAARWTEDLGE